jgi:LysM repeat protein
VSSLRPLATIALLAAVGVFLYMKINETEPKLSPELEEWSTSELEVGGDFATAPDASAPSAPPTDIGGHAPPFSSAQLNPPIATPSAAPGGNAPAWSPGPTSNGSDRTATPSTTADSSPVARSADATPPMPEMPAMPGGSMPNPANTTTNSAPTPNTLGDAPAFGATAPLAAASAGAAAGAATNDPTSTDVTPTPETNVDTTASSAPSTATTSSVASFPTARVAVQGALDRGELAQALAMLSEWYGDPSLTPAEVKEVNDLLAQLAGSVIYEGPPAHRLLPPHRVKDGETLESIAGSYNVPWQLLAKINGVDERAALTPGQELKVVPGPFSAVIDLSERTMTLKLDRRYAGKFALEVDPTLSVEEGSWRVDQKLLTPSAGSLYSATAGAGEDRSLLLANLANPTGQAAVVRGPGASDPISPEPPGRVFRLKTGDVTDIYDILSVGSRVTIQR